MKSMNSLQIEGSSAKSGTAKSRTCLACGAENIKPGRRYCSKRCREQIDWVLSLSKGLLRTFNARYAAFSFNRTHVVLDMLPVWSKSLSRFILMRRPGNKPAEDLKRLILSAGEEWHRLVANKTSRSHASLILLEKNHLENLDPVSIRPDVRSRPKLTKGQERSLKLLKLERKDLFPEENGKTINTAYRRMAKVHHPDLGGDAEKFKELNEAYKCMILWSENPRFTSRKALRACWSYDGATNRWHPPL